MAIRQPGIWSQIPVARQRQGLVLLLLLLTVALYGPVRNHGFVNYDDDVYVTANPLVTGGLDSANAREVFLRGHTPENNMWHPLTSWSHQLDVELFGLNGGAHLIINVLLHTLAAVLLLLSMHRLTGAFWLSAIMAMLFAWHPQRVESVAWVSERKDVMSGLCWMLTLWAYSHYAPAPSRKRHLVLIGAFALAIMSKPSVVTLPCVLLLLDVWPLNRLPPGSLQRKPRESWTAAARRIVVNHKHLLIEKIPLFVLSGVLAVMTLWTQSQGPMKSLDAFPLGMRIANALVSYVKYIELMVIPHGLSVVHPYPTSIPVAKIALAVALLGGISWFAMRRFRTAPYLLVGWCWYLGSLVPSIGLIQVGGQAMANHYSYLPHIGLYIMGVWGLADVVRARSVPRAQVAMGTVLALGMCLFLTRLELRHWRNSETLFRRAIELTGDVRVATLNLANFHLKEGRFEEAAGLLSDAVAKVPDDAILRNNLGLAYLSMGKIPEAMEQYSTALKLNPQDYDARLNMGNLLVKIGQPGEAANLLLAAVQQKPDDPACRFNLGLALAGLGQLESAVEQYETAIQLDPGHVMARQNLGLALLNLGRTEEAIEELLAAVNLDPEFFQAFTALGHAFARLGRTDDAESAYLMALRLQRGFPEAVSGLARMWISQGRTEQALSFLEAAVRINPDIAETHYLFANVLLQQNRGPEAIREFRETLRLSPRLPAALISLAWLRATHSNPEWRDGKEALRLAQQACELTGFQVAQAVDALAAAQAESGDLTQAAETAGRALSLAMSQPNPDLAKRIQERLDLYRSGQPYRSPETP